MADRIEVTVEDNTDAVNLKDAVPLGLAAVEAIKHAFPDARKGRLSISFRAPKLDQEEELVIRDDGVGIPGHMGTSPRGAGLSLAAALARQVGGRLVIENNNGTVWRLCFAGGPEMTLSISREARRREFPRARCKVSNWPEYDRAPQQRGSLTVWMTPEAIAAWHPPHTGQRGRARAYSDVA